jgi:hypothetical protein
MTTGTAKDPYQYPVLRNLQFSPIKEGEEQYIVLWDPSGLSKEKLVLPLNYFFIIQHLDGEHSLQEIGALYLKRFGEFLMPNKVEQLIGDLDAKLFLEGKRTEVAKEQARVAYRQAPVRPAAFAGKIYEADGAKLKKQIDGFFASKEGPDFKPSDNQGKLIATNDDIVPRQDTNSEIRSVELANAGTYRIIVQSFSGASSGDYTLTIERETP